MSGYQISYISIGVSDMQPVRQLWLDQFGLDVRAERSGPDKDLAALWSLEPQQINHQLLLGAPGAQTGLLHFVEFADPGAPIRRGAASTAQGAKNIDVNCVDLPARVAQLQAHGFHFRSAIGEYEIEGVRAREVQMPVHDDLNVVLIEVLDAGFELELSPAGFAGLTSFVIIVPDVAMETQFYQRVFRLDEVLQHQLSGPAIEMAAALPAGTVLDLHLLGAADNMLGRIELIEYKGVPGKNLFAQAIAPATGILAAGIRTPDLRATAALLSREGGRIESNFDQLSTLVGAGATVSCRSPAGMPLQLWEA